MAGVCPVPAPGDPLVGSLLASTDCQVQVLVRSGYGALFEANGPFSAVLTTLLTVYVALVGYRLLLGRGQLNASEFALTAVKLGAVVALATQWGTYQTVVYRLLFDGPQELADALMRGLGAHGGGYRGDVFAGLQHAFDDLTAFSPAAPPGAAAAPAAPVIPPALAAAAPTAAGLPAPALAGSSLLSKSGFDALLMLSSAVILLLTSLGVLLASKIVLGLLLAVGPVFIAMLLFDTTRGLFAGWLRASLAFAFAPLSTTLMLGLALSLLEPQLAQIEAMRDSGTYTPGVAFAVLILTLVFAGVSLGLAIAAGTIAAGFKPPGRRTGAADGSNTGAPAAVAPESAQPGRAARVAAAAVAQDRRDAALFGGEWSAPGVAAAGDRRAVVTLAAPTVRAEGVVPEARLGQKTRRRAQPRASRAGARGSRTTPNGTGA